MMSTNLQDHTFFRNTIYNMIYKVVSVIFPFFMTIYVSKILGADGIGKISSAQNFVMYFTMIASLGIPSYGIKAVAKMKSKIDRSQIFWELFYINFFSTTICVILYYIIIPMKEYSSKLSIIFGMLIVFNYANLDWFFYGIEEFKYITVRSCIIKILALLLTIIYIKKYDDYSLYAAILCFASGGNNIINILGMRKHVYFIPVWKCKFYKHYKPVLTLLLTSISIELYSLLDVSMLSVYCSDKIVGYYTTASKFVKIMITLLVSISGALLPRLTLFYHQNNIKKCVKLIEYVFDILIFFAIPCGVGVFIVAPYAIPLIYGPSFINAVSTVRIFSFLFACLTFSNLFGSQILLTVGKENKLFIATFIGMIINVVLNFLLIPIYENNGAGIASVISEVVVTFFTYWFSREFFKLNINKNLIVNILIGTLLMAISLTLVNHLLKTIVTKTIVDVVMGAFIYFSYMILFGGWKYIRNTGIG